MPTVFELPSSLVTGWVEKEGAALLRSLPPAPPVLDASKTQHADSSGISLLSYIIRHYANTGKKIVVRNPSAELLSALKGMAASFAKEQKSLPRAEGILAGLGSGVSRMYDTLVLALSMLAEIIYWSTLGMLSRRDFRKGAIEHQMFLMGYKALGIVGLLSFLIGNVLALQAAMQLSHFGAGIFLAPMIVISMIKELGPLLTAIILTGRNGSAITAEIATMVVGEEIDALRTMGLHPIQFVIVPKFFAMSVTMPLLSITASLFGLLGGYLVAIFYLDISSGLFIREMMKNIVFADVVANIVKSVVFSWLIIWIGAFHGFRVKGGAEAVGRATTASVVTGIFIIIMADAAFSFVF